MRHFLYILSAALLAAAVTGCSGQKKYTIVRGYAQGGSYHIIYSPYKSDGTRIGASEDSVASVIGKTLRDVDFSISGYNRESILSRTNRGEDCQLDSIFINIFEISKRIYEETGGLFDVSGSPLFDFWGFGFSSTGGIDSLMNDEVTSRKIDSLLEFTGMDLVRIENGRLVKSDPRVRLSFDAIAQGYTCDLIAMELDRFGIEDYLVEVGSEIVCKGLNYNGDKWRIGLEKPIEGNYVAGSSIQDTLLLTDCGITTSGNYRKFYIMNGKKYGHSIDPVSGYPAQQDLLSATVITNRKKYPGAYSDAYATYCMVIGADRALAFIRSKDDLSGYLITDSAVMEVL